MRYKIVDFLLSAEIHWNCEFGNLQYIGYGTSSVKHFGL